MIRGNRTPWVVLFWHEPMYYELVTSLGHNLIPFIFL
jgi:hypothetical protein